MVLYILIIVLGWYGLLKCLGIDFTGKKLVQSFRAETSSYGNFVDYLSSYQRSGQVPKYKFFSDIVEKLESYQRKFGMKIDHALREIRKAAQQDKKESKKVQEQLYGLIFQYLLISIFTWIFLINMELTLNLSFGSFNKLLLLGWQSFGLIISLILFTVLKKIMFKNFVAYFYTTYIFRSLVKMSMPISEVMSIAKLNELKHEKSLAMLKKRILFLIQQLKKNGYLPADEFDNICSELWDIHHQKLTKFGQLVLGLKMASILFFVLPGFLFGIYLSMNQLLV